MAENDAQHRARRATVSLKVNLQLQDGEAFAEEFAENISRTGLFIRTDKPADVGTKIKFEYSLADKTRIMRGLGIVRWVRNEKDAQLPERPPGMGLEFIDIDAGTEALITGIVAKHGEGVRAPRKKRKVVAAPAETPKVQSPVQAPEMLDSEEANLLDAFFEPGVRLEKQTGSEVWVDLCGDRWRVLRDIDQVPEAVFSGILGGVVSSDADAIPLGAFGLVDAATPWVKAAASVYGLLEPLSDQQLEVIAAKIVKLGSYIRIIVPTAVSPQRVKALAAILSNAGAASVQQLSEVAVVQQGAKGFLDAERPWVFAVLGACEMRLTVVGKDGSILAATANPLLGQQRVVARIFELADVVLLREHGIDLKDDDSLGKELTKQICAALVESPKEISLSIAGAQVCLRGADMSDLTMAAQVTFGMLVVRAGISLEDVATCVLCSEMAPWPGLTTGMRGLFGTVDTIAGADKIKWAMELDP